MTQKIPKRIKLILSETSTIFLLNISSFCELCDTENGTKTQQDNKLYEYLTSAKGRNRKTHTVGVQTLPKLIKTRSTDAAIYTFAENGTFASNWEMYDTYRARKKRVEYTLELNYDEIDELNAFEDIVQHPITATNTEDLNANDILLAQLTKNEKFFHAALVIERLLANNTYNTQQKRFKGLSDPDPFRPDIKFKYNLNLLWTFANEKTKNRAVSSVAFNSINDDIVAVGYGKYFYHDRKTDGLVMVWSVKNPTQPERHFCFPSPVTAIAFSEENPNVLAVGFYNGHIQIIDVSNRSLLVLRKDTSASIESVNHLLWFRQWDQEHLLACYADGSVNQFELIYNENLVRKRIMRTLRTEGKAANWQEFRMYQGSKTDATRVSSADFLCLHPSDPYTYYVTSGEGIVHRCSFNKFDQHLSMFKAHNGRVNSIKWSPFLSKVYGSCGNDFAFCFWVEGIEEPLIVSRFSLEAVLDFDWSPSHSTILVTVRGEDICVWDLQRKIYQPQNQVKTAANSINTICRFTKDGRCLIVGDVEGNVHVFALDDMPMPAFYQENAFVEAMKRLLVTQPRVLKEFGRMGNKLNFGRDEFKRYFN